MTRDQTLGIMAATIYAQKKAANPDRKRLDTLRSEAICEAVALFEDVLERDEESE